MDFQISTISVVERIDGEFYEFMLSPLVPLFGLQSLLVHLCEAPKKKIMNNPQPRFLLREPNNNKPTSIYCNLRFNNDRIVFATGEKIHPAERDNG